jgi:glycosyltransferase involved in cell wall biosynthesis
MTKVLTYNVPLDSNLSYAHVFNRAIDYTKDIDWYYGAYGYNGSVFRRENYTLVPCVPHPQNGMPQHIHQTIKDVKPDLLIMHEDMQRIQWIPDIREIPTVLWIPWDNEDMRSIRDASNLMRTCDVPILVNKFSQKLFRQFGVNAKQIYNAVDTQVYYKDETAGDNFRKRLKIPEGHKLLTWVGRAGWRKRFSHVLEIFSRIHAQDPTVHLYLHTDFHDPANQFQPEELLWAKGMLKTDAIYYPGDLNFATGFPSDIMRGIYNATDIYISPAAGEGMGLPLVEALACEKPIISTDYSTTQEIAGYKERNSEMMGTRGIGVKMGYLFKDKGIDRPYVDINDFVDKTMLLLKDDKLRRQMGAAGKQFVDEEVSCQVVAGKLRDVFKSISDVNIEKVKF